MPVDDLLAAATRRVNEIYDDLELEYAEAWYMLPLDARTHHAHNLLPASRQSHTLHDRTINVMAWSFQHSQPAIEMLFADADGKWLFTLSQYTTDGKTVTLYPDNTVCECPVVPDDAIHAAQITAHLARTPRYRHECGWVGTEREMMADAVGPEGDSEELWSNWICPKCCEWGPGLEAYELLPVVDYTPARHRLEHELWHHLVGIYVYGEQSSPIIWREAHGVSHTYGNASDLADDLRRGFRVPAVDAHTSAPNYWTSDYSFKSAAHEEWLVAALSHHMHGDDAYDYGARYYLTHERGIDVDRLLAIGRELLSPLGCKSRSHV